MKDPTRRPNPYETQFAKGCIAIILLAGIAMILIEKL